MVDDDLWTHLSFEVLLSLVYSSFLLFIVYLCFFDFVTSFILCSYNIYDIRNLREFLTQTTTKPIPPRLQLIYKAQSMSFVYAGEDNDCHIYNGPGTKEDAIAKLPTVGELLGEIYDLEDYIIG